MPSALYFVAHPVAWEAFARWNFANEALAMGSGNFGLHYAVHLALQALGVSLAPETWSQLASAWRLIALSAASAVALVTRRSSVMIGGTGMLLVHFVTYGHVWEHHYSAVVLVMVVAYLYEAGSTARARGQAGRRAAAQLQRG